MRVRQLHSWDVTTTQAIDLQRRLANDVITTGGPTPNDDIDEILTIAGVDLSPPDPETGLVRGAAVVLTFPDLEVVEVSTAHGIPRFPYVPGLLSFREAPALIEALASLTVTPNLLLVDGQGTAHPRRFGLACHLGLLVDIPTIGCAKSRLVGTHDQPPDERGASAPLIHRGERIGAAVRTRTGVSPIYVSVGHRISLEGAVHWATACARRYRVPEPTRLAHFAAAGRDLAIVRR